MSRVSGWVAPLGRAFLEAVLSKGAAPGRNMPDSDQPPTDCAKPRDEQPGGDVPEQPQSEPRRCSDTRTVGQRNHDALIAMARTVLESGSLGHHNGLPVTVIVTTTLQELHKGAGHAVTAGDARLPMRDLIREAAHSYHYLAVFDGHTHQALYLGRTKRSPPPPSGSCCWRARVAAPGRGAACPAIGPRSITPPRTGTTTAKPTSMSSRWPAAHTTAPPPTAAGAPAKRNDGRTEWLSPPALDTGQHRINNYHQPWRNLLPDDEAGDQSDGP